MLSDTGDRVRILALAGEIDLHFLPIFRALLREKRDEPPEALVLDLSEVAFIDSSGIAAIIEHLRTTTQAGSRFVIGGMSEAVKDIFEVINLRKSMPIFESREAALEALKQKRLAEPGEPLFTPAD